MAHALWPIGVQTALSSLGLTNLHTDRFNVTSDASFDSAFFASPLAGLTSLLGNGDYSMLFARFVQFGALGSVLQFFGISELLRWACNSLYEYIIGRFVLRIYFEGAEQPYSWLMLWLSKQKSWTNSRDVQVSTTNFGLGPSSGTLVPGEDMAGKEGQRLLTLVPWNDTTTTIWFKRRFMRVSQSQQTNKTRDGLFNQNISLTITMYTRKHQIMYDLLLEAKKQYEAELESRVVVYNLDQWNNWIYCGSRPKRSMNSVIIAEETKQLLLEDAKDFADSEEWYGQRGIPWQRGWLLYGAPGSGKTSTIQALAGELGLSIYVVTLSKRGMDDTTLNTAINAIPARAMILMEDIDAAFTRSVNREAPVPPPSMTAGMGITPDQLPPASVTLSGLLNAIDGVQAQQGRLLFATTNKYDSLDPALVRPGRLDLHIEFTLASKWQASELFKRFYPVEKTAERSVTLVVPPDSEATDTGAASTMIFGNAEGEQGATVLVEEPDESLDAVQRISATSLKVTQRGRKAPRLSHEELSTLAQQFSDAIPEQELSMAAIQGHLMMHKTRPHEAARSAPRFVIQERERKIKAKEITREQAEEQGIASQVATTAASKKNFETDNKVDTTFPALGGQRQSPEGGAGSGNVTALAAPREDAGQTSPAADTAGTLTDSVVVI